MNRCNTCQRPTVPVDGRHACANAYCTGPTENNVTDLQHDYYEARATGYSHTAALVAVARRHNLDRDSVTRALKRVGTTSRTPIPDHFHRER